MHAKVFKDVKDFILIVDLPDAVCHNSARACLTGMQTETLMRKGRAKTQCFTAGSQTVFHVLSIQTHLN